MRSFDEIEARYRTLPPPAQGRGTIGLILVRRSEGLHETLVRARLDPAGGLEGDRWARGQARDPAAQLTLMNSAVAGAIGASTEPLHMPGDNFLTDLDLGAGALPVSTRLRIGGALIEITAKPHSGCHKLAARFGPDALRWVNWHAHRDRRLRGVHCRVIEAGEVSVGDAIEVIGAA